MRKFITAVLATLILLPAATVGAGAQGNGHGGGDPHGCINPAGHVRGWCKSGNGTGKAYAGSSSGAPRSYATISGTVFAVNGDIAQFRQDNGTTITVNQSALLNSGMGLNTGGHYTLRGFWSNDMFVAQGTGSATGYGNGYPYPGSQSSVRGIITAISNNRVTIMQGLLSSVSINDQQAINNGTAQNLYIGRTITAYGYWNGGTFYATSIG